MCVQVVSYPQVTCTGTGENSRVVALVEACGEITHEEHGAGPAARGDQADPSAEVRRDRSGELGAAVDGRDDRAFAHDERDVVRAEVAGVGWAVLRVPVVARGRSRPVDAEERERGRRRIGRAGIGEEIER